MIFYFVTIVSTFSLSTLSVLFLCRLYNTPFFHPKKPEQFREQCMNVVKMSSIFVLEYSVFGRLFARFSPGSSIFHIINYVFCIEMLYYAYHRLIHTRWLYKPFHSLHHRNVIVYPIDTFYFDIVDVTAYTLCICYPLQWIHVSYWEHVVVLYLYIMASYLSHSNIFFTHHALHHRRFDCNFCILFPIFDVIYGTYRE